LSADDVRDFGSEVLEDRELVAVRENGPGKFVAFVDERIELLRAVEVGEGCSGVVPPLDESRCGSADKASRFGGELGIVRSLGDF